MKTGIEQIAAERKRQVEKEKWTPEHDDVEHTTGSLAIAGACYALTPDVRDQRILNKSVLELFWPWEIGWWKPTSTPKDDQGKRRIRELVKAGALMAAEIDRLQRLLHL
jgi:hypothetical protein